MSTEDQWNDEEEWYDEDLDTDSSVIACPECGAEVFDDADQCPQCGHWILDEQRDSSAGGRTWPRVVRWVAVVLLAAWLGAILMGAIR